MGQCSSNYVNQSVSTRRLSGLGPILLTDQPDIVKRITVAMALTLIYQFKTRRSLNLAYNANGR
jgi:hypothetical protein